MKKKLAIFSFLFLYLLTNSYLFAQQDMTPTIQSVYQSNILWSNPNSWLEKRIPTENDIVQLNGDLILDNNFTILSLIIEQESSLININGYNKELIINKNFSNYGVILDNSSGGLYLKINGNIKNEGEWKNTQTSLVGNDSRKIESNNFIGGTIILADNFEITSSFELSGMFNLNNKILTVNSPNIATFNDISGTGTVNGTGKLVLKGNTSAIINGNISEFIFSGISELVGSTISLPNIIVSESAVIKNINGYNKELTLSGNVTNYGIIQNNSSGGLYLKISGNIINNGEWKNAQTSLIGNNSRKIESNNSIYGYIEISDNIEITNSFDLSGSLKLNNYTLTINSPNVAKFGGVTGKGTLNGNGKVFFKGNSSATINGTISELIFSGTDQVLSGALNLPNVTFSGSSIISDLSINGNTTIKESALIKNLNGYNKELTFNGNISNYGIIKNNSSGVLQLTVSGNMKNDGEWKNSQTSLVGSDSRMIESSTPIGGTIILADNFEITSSFELSGMFNLNNKILTVNSPNIATFNDISGTGTVNGTGKLVLKGNTSAIINGNISEFIFSGISELVGSTISLPNIIVSESAVIKNINGYNKELTLSGNVTNYGIIQNNSSGGLYLKISGNIINSGEWKNAQTSIYWKNIHGAINYQLFISDSILLWPTDPTTVINTTNYDISAILSDTKYWKIRANMDNYVSNFSNIKSINAQNIYKYKILISISEYQLPLHNATISIPELEINTNTNEEGFFTLADIPVGNYKLDVKPLGLESYESTIQISEIQADIKNVIVKLPKWLEASIEKNIIQKFDVNSDAKIGIKEAIHALNCVVNIKD